MAGRSNAFLYCKNDVNSLKLSYCPWIVLRRARCLAHDEACFKYKTFNVEHSDLQFNDQI